MTMITSLSLDRFDAAAVLAHARAEANRLASELAEEGFGILVEVDRTLRGQEILVKSDAAGVVVRGGSESATLHGVYTFFEKLGCVFSFSGELLPARKATVELPTLEIRHTPGVLERGIRMHLNFVQDQSYFSEAEFESFIDNMAKQRWNCLQFHQYTQLQWFPFEYRGVRHLDHQFGRDRASLPPEMIGREKVQVRDHWFPREFESLRDPEQILTAMHTRFQRMMKRARTRGIWNSVSMEPESLPPGLIPHLPKWSEEPLISNSDLAQEWQSEWSGAPLKKADVRHPLVIDINVERVLQCMDSFPDLDEVQLISGEGASWEPGPGESYEGELARLAKKFDLSADFFDHAALGRVVPPDAPYEMLLQAHPRWTVMPGRNYYGCVVSSLRMVEHALAVFQDSRVTAKLEVRGVRPSIAVYSPDPEVVRLMMPAIARMMPAGMSFQALADYSARDIARNLPAWQPLKDGGQTIGIISWLEFDGIMTLCQGWVDSLIENVKAGVHLGVRTMTFNHWRVRSLEHNAAAASALCWDPDQSPEDFKSDYFGRLFGRGAVTQAIDAYAKLESATEYAKQFTYNVGFCHDWVIRITTNPPGYHWSRLVACRNLYEQAAKAFELLVDLAEPPGVEQARYIRDICRISVLHVDAVRHLQNAKLPLFGYKAWPLGNPACCWPEPDTLAHLLDEIRAGLALQTEYMTIFSKWVKTCDEQGQLCGHQQGIIEPWTHFAKALELELERALKLQKSESLLPTQSSFV